METKAQHMTGRTEFIGKNRTVQREPHSFKWAVEFSKGPVGPLTYKGFTEEPSDGSAVCDECYENLIPYPCSRPRENFAHAASGSWRTRRFRRRLCFRTGISRCFRSASRRSCCHANSASDCLCDTHSGCIQHDRGYASSACASAGSRNFSSILRACVGWWLLDVAQQSLRMGPRSLDGSAALRRYMDTAAVGA